MQGYYVYEWIRADINEPFYVGKGKNSRCFDTDRNKHFSDVLTYCIRNNIEVAVVILEENLTETEAYELECGYIHQYIFEFGFNLTNKTWGGEGGDIVSMMSQQKKEEYSKKMSESLKGKNTGPRSEEVKRKISETKRRLGIAKGERNPMYGKHIKDYMTEESYNKWKENVRNSLIGRKQTEETKKKISKAHKGKILSDETKQKLKIKNLGANNPMYNKHHSKETKMLIAKSNEKKLVVEFNDGNTMLFESRNKCAKYFDENYGVSIYTIKKLLKTGERLNSRYKKFNRINGIRIYYINNSTF